MPWQNVRKWLEDEIETKDKDSGNESLAEKLRAQISSDDFAEEMEQMKEPEKDTADSSDKKMAADNDDDGKEADHPAEETDDTAGKTPVESKKSDKTETPKEASQTMTARPTMPEPVTYGIEEATELMRGLPEDHIELVALVVKRTLESTNVKVSTIIDDASQKQKRIDDRISLLKNEINKFEEEIALRKGEISTLENEGEEITTVKERLKLAEQLSIKESAEKEPQGTPPASSAKGANTAKAKKQPAAKK